PNAARAWAHASRTPRLAASTMSKGRLTGTKLARGGRARERGSVKTSKGAACAAPLHHFNISIRPSVPSARLRSVTAGLARAYGLARRLRGYGFERWTACRGSGWFRACARPSDRWNRNPVRPVSEPSRHFAPPVRSPVLVPLGVRRSHELPLR